MDFVQKSKFFYCCLSQELCQKRSFLDILNRKQSFLDQKIEVLTRTKKWTFLKGLVHGFCPKIEFFLICFFHRKSIRKQRFWCFGKKRMILSGKNWSFKKGHKKDIFKGVSPWLCPKLIICIIAYFSLKLCHKR